MAQTRARKRHEKLKFIEIAEKAARQVIVLAPLFLLQKMLFKPTQNYTGSRFGDNGDYRDDEQHGDCRLEKPARMNALARLFAIFG